MRVAALAGKTSRSPSGAAMFAPAAHNKGVVLDSRVARVFDACRAFRPLGEQIRHAAAVSGLATGVVRSSVLELLARGLLVREDQAVDSSAGPRWQRQRLRSIHTVGITTADRPDICRRALRSYVSALTRHGRSAELVVVDGSRDPGRARSTEAAVEDMRCRSSLNVRYVGRSNRRRVIDTIRRAGVPPGVAEWIFCERSVRMTPGATRNLLAVSVAPGAFMTVDDDTVASLRRPEWCEEGIAFEGHGDPRETAWCASRAASTTAGYELETDLLELHERLLGWDLRQLYGAFAGCCDTSAICPHVMSAVQGATPGRVRASWMGVAGDGAQYCPQWNLLAGGATRAAMIADEASLARAMKGREVIRAVRRWTVTDLPAFMTYCAGLDGESLLPPFMPVGTNEDGLWGTLLKSCDPGAFIAQIPAAIVHDSERGPEHEEAFARSAAHVRLNDLLRWLTTAWSSNAVRAAVDGRMRELGRYLQELVTDTTPDEFSAAIRRVVSAAKWQLICQCDAALAQHPEGPRFWRRAVESYRQTACDSLGRPGYEIPIEFQGLCEEEAVVALRYHLSMFGQTLIVWPDVWAMRPLQ
jgi:hypothetical protein